jgi:uncharacterized phage infection (PIP) family protein YhgE
MSEGRLESAAQRIDAQLQELASLIQRITVTLPSGQWALNSQIDSKLSDLNQLIDQMSQEVKQVPVADQSIWNSDISGYRDRLTELNAEMRLKRASLSTTTPKGQSAIDNLDQALKIGSDTSATMAKTQVTLLEDRETLERISGNVDGVIIEANTARERLRRMFCRAVGHKILVWVIVVFLGAVFVFSVGLRFGVIDIKGGGSPTPEPQAFSLG